ncbi:hypothetical protein, partial [Gordonibacter sp.]|uniref:hypothetical protein n=1 Tax=Gordonibacter sp. TaxID=1968902 RepID=UPI002FC98314
MDEERKSLVDRRECSPRDGRVKRDRVRCCVLDPALRKWPEYLQVLEVPEVQHRVDYARYAQGDHHA